ncbi:MAG: DUF2304 domain-containing protein [Cellulomonadaceae bacterium]
MLAVQVLLLVSIGVIAVLLNRSTADARHQAIRRLLLAGFVVAAALSVIFPQWLSHAANLLGVGRGTDLVLYALVIAFLGYIASNHRRTSRLSAQITALTRELTLAEARYEDGPAGGDEPGGRGRAPRPAQP